ncbi:hypothetical protein FA95DRAFT_1610702 [Auriscalpium vulgare]|uniref:Uncharacterized protein n=1 Tax=Auriscalpium vulgare TaxID=40419 RepID=A0ACB8RE06_9AGAM|nr:hypothetical protein FA95DRAFT_1610702 [Auriscalpium vulgare]
MPLDILFEIFVHLPPADLIQLTRVSKAFRQILLTRRVSWLWKASYALDPNVPPCPEDMTLPAWAHLLYGGAICHTCGAKRVHKVMFLFRRRACKDCIRENVCKMVEIPLPLSHKEKKLADCIPSFIGEVKSHGLGRFWWNTDVAALLKKLDGMRAKYNNTYCDPYEQDVAALETHMQAAYQTRHAVRCEEWEDNRIEDRSAEIRNIKIGRFDDIIVRLQDMGHEYIDIKELWDHKEVDVAKPLTDRIWKRICPILELALVPIVEQRLHEEAFDRWQQRRGLVLSTYAEYLEGLPVRLAPLLATPAEVLEYSAFTDAIADDVLDEAALADLNERLRGIMRELGLKLLKNAAMCAMLLISVLPADVRGNCEETLLCTEEFHIGAACGLGLATTHFTLDEAPNPSGSESRLQLMTGLEMLAHRSWRLPGSQAVPRYSETAAIVAGGLVAMLGLGPSTTAYEMDRANARFSCGECLHGKYIVELDDGELVDVSSTRCWRNAVEHGMTRHYDVAGQRALAWTKIPSDWTKIPQPDWQPRRTTQVPRDWGCAHCQAHQRVPLVPGIPGFGAGSPSPWYTAAQAMDHLLIA